TADALEIYMKQFWHTVTYDLTTKTYFFILDDQIFEVNVELLHEALQITPKDYDHPFVEPPSKKAIHSFINKLAMSLGTKPVKTRGKGLLTKQGVEIAVERVKEEEPQLTKRRQNSVTIRRETHGESNEKNLDHSSKLKGNETLCAAAQFKLDMKKTRKASKDDFFIQQHPKGLGEGSGVTLEVPDGLSHKGPNEGSGVTQAVIDEPSGSSSSSSSKSEIEDIFSDDESDGADDKEKADDSKTAGDEKAIEEQKPADQRPPLVDTTITMIPETTLSSTQPPPKRSKTKRIIKKSKKLETQVDTKVLDKRLTRLEKKVEALSRFNIPEAINKSVKAHLMKNVLPKDAPDFGKTRQEKATKQSMLKCSTKPFDEDSLTKYD
ncbi:hypothetical protein Tco_1224999, partial [Tanacetum coccineum]